MNPPTNSRRGGKRQGSGRKPQGKARYTVSLNLDNAQRAKGIVRNLSALMDDLLASWLRNIR